MKHPDRPIVSHSKLTPTGFGFRQQRQIRFSSLMFRAILPLFASLVLLSSQFREVQAQTYNCYSPPNGVALYSEPDFRGRQAAIEHEYYDLWSIPTFGNTMIKSICISPGVVVRLYPQVGFGGPSVEFTSSVADLTRQGLDIHFRSIRLFRNAEHRPTSSAGAVEIAAQRLATILGTDVSDIEVLPISPMEWPTSGLGCERPGKTYPRVISPGYRFVLRSFGGDYIFHTGNSSGGTSAPRVILCEVKTTGDEVKTEPQSPTMNGCYAWGDSDYYPVGSVTIHSKSRCLGNNQWMGPNGNIFPGEPPSSQ